MALIPCLNRYFQHQDLTYHIQAEDLGVAAASFEVKIYDHGTVLWLKRISYSEIIEQALEEQDQEQAVRMKIEKILHTIEAAIARGKLDTYLHGEQPSLKSATTFTDRLRRAFRRKR